MMNEETRQEWDALSATRSRLSRLLLSGPNNLSSEEYKKTIEAIQKEIEKAEKSLMDKSNLVASNLKQRQVTARAVAERMPENSALLEFVNIPTWTFKKSEWGDWRYLAFVLKPDGKVNLLDLGKFLF